MARVGIDVDNVLNKFSQALAESISPDQENMNRLLKKLHEKFYIEKVMHLTREQVEKHFEDNFVELFGATSIRDEYTVDMIRGLFLRHNTLHIITNRSDFHPNISMSKVTTHWLYTVGLTPYIHDIHYVKGCKHTYCKEQGLEIDIMVEDNLERALAFIEAGIPVVLFDYEYNRNVQPHPLLYRVRNWWEAFQSIVRIEQKLKEKMI